MPIEIPSLPYNPEECEERMKSVFLRMRDETDPTVLASLVKELLELLDADSKGTHPKLRTRRH